MRRLRNTFAAALLATLSTATIATHAQTAPATPPAAPPATTAKVADLTPAQIAARTALSEFFHAMFQGDQKTAFSHLTYSDLDDKKAPKFKATAELMFGSVMAEQRLRLAASAAFGEAANNLLIGKSAKDAAAFEKDLAGATVSMDEPTNTANVQMGTGPAFVVVLKEGKWLVDFDKSQSNIGPLPLEPDLAIETEKMAGYDQIAKDIAAKKFGSFEELKRQIDRLHDAIDAKLASQTKPGATTAPRP